MGIEMKVCVIGTSNTILKHGWFDGFSDNWNGPVTRIALGGAPFIQFAGRLPEIVANPYDLIILETSPNDESYAGTVGTELFFEHCYFRLLVMLRQHAPTLVLRIPTRTFLCQPSRILELQKRVSSLVGCQFVDLSTWISSNSENSQFADALYRDNYHPNTMMMNQIGSRVADISRELVLNERREPVWSRWDNPFDIVSVPDVGFAKRRMSTSHIDAEFTVIPAGQSVKFEQSFYCLGFFIDASHCNGIVRLHGVEAERDVFCYYNSEKNVKTARFVPVHNGFHVKAISVPPPHRSINFGLHSDFGFAPPYFVSFGGLLQFRVVHEPFT